MPTYAYHCRTCHDDFEVRQSFSDDPLTDCLICEASDAVFRVIQPAGVVFKGSGWYATDHRSSASGNGSTPSSRQTTESDNGSTGDGSTGDSSSTKDEGSGKEESKKEKTTSSTSDD